MLDMMGKASVPPTANLKSSTLITYLLIQMGQGLRTSNRKSYIINLDVDVAADGLRPPSVETCTEFMLEKWSDLAIPDMLHVRSYAVPLNERALPFPFLLVLHALVMFLIVHNLPIPQ